MTVKVIDLFCGAGGLTHGLQLAGLDVVAGIDLEGNVGFPMKETINLSLLSKISLK